MGRSAGQIHALHVATAVGRLERSKKPAVTGQPVDCSVKNVVALVDVFRSQGLLENNAVLQSLAMVATPAFPARDRVLFTSSVVL
jgi:hypothetical protein